jgi:hypothetical protein
MALLAEAIRQSDTEAAVCVLPDGTRVLVQRVTGREGPFDQEEYAVRTQRPGEPAVARMATDNLIEALGGLRQLALAGFDPATADWQPVFASARERAEYEQSAHRPSDG